MNEHKIKIPDFSRKDIEHEPVPINPEIEQLEKAYYERFGSYDFPTDYYQTYYDNEEVLSEKHIRILKKCLKTNRRYEKVAHTLLYKLWEWWVKPIF